MGGLGFLSPLFLLGALAVAIPVVLHLFRRRNDPVVPFSAMRFLQQVPIEQARRRRLQDLLLLALRVAALLLLAIGFARPYLQSPMSRSEPASRSWSLTCRRAWASEPRTAKLRDLVREAIDAAPAGTMPSGSCGSRRPPTCSSAPTLDRALPCKAAASQLMPGFGPTMLSRRRSRAPRRCSARRRAAWWWSRICRAGDGPAGAGTGLPSGTEVAASDVGALPRNAGIATADIDTRRARRSCSQYRWPARRDGQLRSRRRAARRPDGASGRDGTADVTHEDRGGAWRPRRRARRRSRRPAR